MPGSHGPRHLQLYFYDTEDQTLAHRAKLSPDLDININQNVLQILQNNPYVQTFNRVGAVPNLDDYSIELNTDVPEVSMLSQGGPQIKISSNIGCN